MNDVPPPSPKGNKKGRFSAAAMRALVDKHRANIVSYSALVVFVFAAWHLVSDGDFSFLMTLGSVVRAFAFVILVFKIWSSQSAAGVSLKTLQLYAMVFFFRLVSILVYDGYLPFDRSGDWFYQFMEVVSLCLVSLAVFLVMRTFRSSYQHATDVFGCNLHLPNELALLWIVGPALLLALLLHPNLNGNFLTDVSWTFALYVEAVAIFPQLIMFQRKGGEVDSFVSHFVFSIGCARLMHFAFWCSSYHELNDRLASHVGAQYPGYFVIVSQLVHLGICADFFYYYFKALKSGGPMMLPVSSKVEV